MGKGVSTIIAAIFVIMIFMLIFIYLAFTMRNFGDIANRFVEIVNEAATREKESLRVTYVVINSTGMYLGIRNEGTVTSIIKGYSIRDLSNNSVQYGTFTNPYVIPPGGSADVRIPGSYRQDAAYLITLVTEVGSIVRTKYPQPVTNVTRVYLLRQQLQTIAGEGTVTWAGQAIIPIPHNITSNITYAEVNGQKVNVVFLKGEDNNYIVKSIRDGIVVLLENNTIFYDDFSTDPLQTGRLRKEYNNYSFASVDVGYNEILQAIYVHLTANFYGYAYALLYYNNINVGNANASKIWILSHTWYEGTVSSWLLGDAYAYGSLTYGLNINDYNRYYASLLENNSAGSTTYSFQLGSTYTDSVMTADLLSLSHYPNEIYTIIIRWLPQEGLHYASLYNFTNNSSPYASLTLSDSSVSNGSIGFYIYAYASGFSRVDIYWYFDNLIISKANPRYLNITGIPNGWNVTIISPSIPNNSLSKISKGAPVVFDVIKYPILRNVTIEVYDENHELVNSTFFPVVVGGNLYAFALNTSIVSESDVRVSKLYVCTAFTANATVNALIKLYNFRAFTYDTIFNVGNVDGLSKCVEVSNYNDYINNTNNTIVNLIIYSNKPFSVNIDMLNTIVTTYIPDTKDVLITGVGGTYRVDVYELGFSSTNLTLSYVRSLDAHSLFDGSTDITYDSDVTMSLIVVNSSGVYGVSLYSGKFSIINDSQPYFPSPGLVSVRAEVLDGKLLVVRGFTNGNDYLLIDLSSGDVVDYGSLDVNISCTKYCVSASDGSNAYLLVLNTSMDRMGKPVIMRYSLGSGWKVLTNFTGYKSTGMCFGNGYLYVMLEMGGLYRISVIDGSYEHLNVNLPFYPRGFGDRLEYYAGNLIFVRDDDTTEVWVISPIG